MTGASGIGSSSRQTDYQSAVELQSQVRSGPLAASGTALEPGSHAAIELGRIEGVLGTYFSGGEEDNDIRDLIRNRALYLQGELGQTASDVTTAVAKAEKLDKISTAMEGAIKVLGYALGGFPGAMMGEALSQRLQLPDGSKLRAFVSTATVGLTGVAFTAVLDKVLEDSLKDIKWMLADKDMLEAPLRQQVEERDNMRHKLTQASVAGVGNDLRNMVTAGISAGLQALPENAPGQFPTSVVGRSFSATNLGNQAAGTTLTLPAGSATGMVQKSLNKLYGAQYLFGRTDWRERYELLTGTSVKSQMTRGGAKRAGMMLKDVSTPRKWLAGMRNLIMFNQMAEMAALGLGLGMTGAVRQAARDAVLAGALSNGLSTPEDLLNKPEFRVLREGVAQAAGIPAAGIAYFTQDMIGVLSKAAMDKVHDWRSQQPGEGSSVSQPHSPQEHLSPIVEEFEDARSQASSPGRISPALIEGLPGQDDDGLEIEEVSDDEEARSLQQEVSVSPSGDGARAQPGSEPVSRRSVSPGSSASAEAANAAVWWLVHLSDKEATSSAASAPNIASAEQDDAAISEDEVNRHAQRIVELVASQVATEATPAEDSGTPKSDAETRLARQ